MRVSIRRVVVLVLLLSSASASAQEAEGSEDPAALFDLGLKAMLEGRLGVGCAFIKRSLDLDPRPGTLFTLAECYRQAGKVASAVELYDRYLALFPKLPEDERQRQAARATVSEQERNRLVPLVPWLTVVLPDRAPSGVVVTMDDEPFAPNLIGVAIAVDPGPHEFTTRAPGGPLIGQVIDLEPGERRSVTLNVRTAGDTDPVSPVPIVDEPVGEDSGGHSAWFYVAGGIGIVGLATGAVSGAILLDKRQTILEECENTDATPQIECTPAGKAAADSAQNVFAPITEIALGVGAAGLAVAAVLWFTEGSSSDDDDAASVRPTFRRIANGGEFVLQGQF